MMAWFFYATYTLTGLIIGSFLNVVIHRGPAIWGLVDDEKRAGGFSFPGSYCPNCKAPIRGVRLIPLIGFIVARGRCKNCGEPISYRYPVVECLGAAAALLSIFIFGLTPVAIMASFYFWILIVLGAIDLETGYLPDVLTLTLIFLGLAVNMIDMFASLPDAFIGAATGYIVFRLIGAVFHKLRGIEGLGQGDAKLLAGLGAWLGWQALPPLIFIAALLGLAGAFVAQSRGAEVNRETPIAFGPALAVAGAVFLVASNL